MNDPILRSVPINEIEVGERFRQDYGNLDDLVHSYKKHGFFSVIALGLNDHEGERPYKLLAGGRRLEACKKKGMTEVNACVYDRELDELELREIELAENVYRKDLTWHENAELTAQINELQHAIHGRKTSTSPDASGWTQGMTAEKLNRSAGAVSRDLTLAKAIKLMPELKNCKSADEAMKTIIKMGNKFTVEELAATQRRHLDETPIGRIRADLVNNYILGDFFAGVADVPNNSIDFIEVDPPYGIDLQNAKKLEDHGANNLDEYNEIDPLQYSTFLYNCIEQCYRVLKPSGWILFWFAHEPWFETVFQTLKNRGFIGNRMVGMWMKQTGQNKRPEMYLANTTEMFFYMRKSTGTIQTAHTNVFQYPSISPNRKTHPTERPIEMIADILKTFCLPGSRVMVPFLGSGNTILAAANVGMNAFGWDLTSHYKDEYTVRVHDGEPGFYTSYPNLEVLSA